MDPSSPRAFDWLSAALLFALIQVAAARLVITNWASYLYYAEVLAASGTILGLALGSSRHHGRILIWFILDYTLVMIPWRMSAAIGLADQNLPLADRLTTIGSILLKSMGQFIQRQTVEETIFFVFVVSLLFWFIGISAGYWLIRRGNVLVAILPAGTAILITQAYDNNNLRASWWLAIFILVALVLLGRHYFLQNQKGWSERRVLISEETWPNIFGSLLACSAGVVLLAWLIPGSLSSWQGAADSWNNFSRPIRDRLSNAVRSLNATEGAGSNFYGDTLALGNIAAHGDTPVFKVQVLASPDFNPRYYWRGHVYDEYGNGQWTNAPFTRVSFQPQQSDINIPDVAGRKTGEYEITEQLGAQSLLYSPSQPVWVNAPGGIDVSASAGNIFDVLAWQAIPAIGNGNRYQVYASIAYPDLMQLRSAGSEYPQAIKDRYLGIPQALLPQLQALAQKITRGQTTPYDKASAITTYLRTNLQYSTSVPSAPSGTDPLLWVLFTYKKAFCNYYASAEVLMLRSVGIPARLAVGFAQGQRENDTYLVRMQDAHAWPEVYFPNIGWIEFEPTTSQQALARPETALQANSASTNSSPPKKKLGEGDQISPAGIVSAPGSLHGSAFPSPLTLLISLCLIGAALILFLFIRYRILNRVPVFLSNTIERNGLQVPIWLENWRRWVMLEPIERSYASINQSLRWLGKPQPLDATPAERATLLKQLVPSASLHIEALSSEFQSALFTPRPPDLPRARRASILVLLHSLRALVLKILGANGGSHLYSR